MLIVHHAWAHFVLYSRLCAEDSPLRCRGRGRGRGELRGEIGTESALKTQKTPHFAAEVSSAVKPRGEIGTDYVLKTQKTPRFAAEVSSAGKFCAEGSCFAVEVQLCTVET